MNINDVAMVEFLEQWAVVVGYDCDRRYWITLVNEGDKDVPSLYKQYIVHTNNITAYKDRLGITALVMKVTTSEET